MTLGMTGCRRAKGDGNSTATPLGTPLLALYRRRKCRTHRLTSSARIRIDSGIVKPSARAVLRLSASFN